MGANFYCLDAANNVREYISLGDSLDSIRKVCAASEFQHLDKKPITIEASKDSGNDCQDFIYENGIPLISERVKDFFDKCEIDYLFYKKVIVKISDVGIEEVYWLALPPRINCLNKEESIIDDFLNVADEICINSQKVGRYCIFKLLEVNNLEIVLTEEFAMKLKDKKYSGMHIYKIN